MKLSKIKALYINEMTKVWRKLSNIILLGIMILGILGLGGLMKLQEVAQDQFMQDDSYIEESNKSEMEYYIDDIKNQLADIEEKSKAASEEDKYFIEQDKARLEAQLEVYEFAKESGISIFTSYYKATALNITISLKQANKLIELTPTELQTNDDKKTIKENNELIEKYLAIVKNSDFEEYIAIDNEQINKDDSLSDEEKKIQLESNELMLKYNITGQSAKGYNMYSNDDMQIIYQIENIKYSLYTNTDSSSGVEIPLTDEQRDNLNNSLAINLYKLDKGIHANESFTNTGEVAMLAMTGFGMFIIIILILILAGGSISSEISTGSIKSLIISPTKRWKIFTAKFLSLLTVGIAAVIVMYLFSIFTHGIFFGFGSGNSYIYATNGVAHELNFYIYKLAYTFIDFIDVIVYLCLAFMLSVVTRNTAASVGISMAFYFGGSIANSFVTLFAKGEWLKFIPFNNFSLAQKIFEYDSLSSMTSGFSSGIDTVTKIPVSFSLCYIAVIIVCMLFTALDSFCKRDIK